MNTNDHTYINTTKLNQILFDQELYINKCSSYIDAQKQYMFAEMILNQHEAALKTPVGRNSKLTNRHSKNVVDNSQLDEVDRTVTATATKSVKNSLARSSIKKFRQVISNKLKKLVTLNNSPEELKFNGKTEQGIILPKSSSTKRKSFGGKTSQLDTSIKLVNFNYKPNFVNVNVNVEKSAPRTAFKPSRYVNNRRNSTGELSSSSSASSLDSNHFLYTSESEQPKQHQQSSCNNFYESSAVIRSSCVTSNCYLVDNSVKEFVETSTPIFNNRIRPVQLTYADRASFLCANTMLLGGHSSQVDFQQPKYEFEDEENDDQVNVALLMDQSTQAIVDSPVLVESTFNTSSLSNLSDDLIILQTASKPRFAPPIVNSTRNSAMFKTPRSTVNNKKRKSAQLQSSNFGNDSFVKSNSKVPRWAIGHELNMALVNQLYFNPSGNGVFSMTNNSVSMNQPSALI